MTPEKIRDFEAEWPLLARRLKLFLGRKKVPASQIDDLIQDTALRLYKMWDSVDRSRPAWALTVTIALNLLRDEYRKAGRADIATDLPDIPQSYDVERAGMARVELGRVREALARMTPAHRSVLLAEVGYGTLAVEPAGDKMRRLRARRKLTQLLEQVSAIFVLPARKMADSMHALLGLKDGLVAGTSCLLCAVLGAGIAVSVPLTPERAEAREVSRVAVAAGRAWAAVEAGTPALVAAAPTSPTRTSGSRATSTGATSRARQAPTNSSGVPSIPLPTGSGDNEPTVPEVDPGGGGVPVPAPPPAPPLPGGSPDNDELEEEIARTMRKATAALSR